MRKLALIISISIILVCSAHAQCTPPPGGWTQSNQPPIACRPYPNSLWNKPLPNAGSGGPLTHLAPNSDAIAQNLLGWIDYSGDGNFTNFEAAGPLNVGTTGNADGNNRVSYYGKASDPIYKLTSCGNPGSVTLNNPTNTFWHIPDQARYSGGQSDMFFGVWDQVSNKVLATYTTGSGTTVLTLPHCTATTNATACSMFRMDYCSMADYSTDKGYAAGNGAGDSLGEAPGAVYIRTNEWMAADFHGIKHALYINTNCEDPGRVFPAVGHAYVCTPGEMGGNGLAALHGALFFLDYTDAQIAAMSIPAWQKSIIWTMAHYGAYVGDTDGSTNRFVTVTRYEADEPFVTAGITNPIFAWLTGQGVGHHTDGTSQVYPVLEWNNIPLLTGPNCPTTTCRISKHAHVAAECVAQGLAGVSGGCTGSSPPPPPPPNACTPPSNGWSVTNQPPIGCRMYPNSVFNKQLPNAGSGGPMTHLMTNSDSIVSHSFAAGHQAGIATPGDADTQGNAFYWGQLSSPHYTLTSCTHQSPSPYNPTGLTWSIPSGAFYSGGQSDMFLTVFDQLNHRLMSLYTSTHSYPTSLSSCSGTCTINVPVGYCNMSDASGSGAQAGNGAGDSLGEAPGALIYFAKEWMDSSFQGIKHALYLNGTCERGDAVYPANGHAQTCSDPTNAPPHGALFFLDYTDQELASMTGLLPAQRAILWTMVHYGGYLGDTGSTTLGTDIHPSRYEGGEAYVLAGLTSPLFAWLSGQGISHHTDGSSQVYTLDYWANVPFIRGSGIVAHMHIADQCVPRGLAGLSGGCADGGGTGGGTPTPPPPPTNLTVTVT